MNPGYFDLQVNGYAGVDFNQDDLDAQALHTACRHLANDGVAGILATVITDTPERMAHRLANVAALTRSDPLVKQVIAGLHVEGPFINPTDGFRGAHPADAIEPANPDAMLRLLEAGGGLVRLVTLAPECDPDLRTTKMLADSGITVAAGHTDASFERLRAAVGAGLSVFTHVGNACPMYLHRHDNIIQRALALADRLWLCFIADGVHVPYVALRNYLRLASTERCVVVTDAIAPAGLGPGRYTVGRWELDIGPDMVARAPDGSHLIGAAITMPQSAKALAEHLSLDLDDIERLTSINPRRALGI